MSYLNPLRLHFAGQFQAGVSTVNNDPWHFNNATFKASYQERQTGNSPDQWNGWFNPEGDADWRLIGCKVTAAWMADGSAAAHDDPILQHLIADSDGRVAAKLVDLDSEQQLVSEIWGLEVRICEAGGTTLLRGQYEPAAFMDIWDRSAGGGGDVGAGAMYQSVLSELQWGAIDRSPFLKQLRGAAADGLLSIKFNVDGFNLDYRSPEFMRGRIVGTIGPAAAAEPRHLVLGRQFMTTGLSTGNFFAPAGKINFCVAALDERSGKIYLDLGNALPTSTAGGAPADLGRLSLLCQVQGAGAGMIRLGDVAYLESGWYERTAGIAALPVDRPLNAEEVRAISNNPLALQLTAAGGATALAIAEPPGGLYLRADRYVFRLNPGETAQARLFATRWGQRYPGARVVSALDPKQLQGGPGGSPLGDTPDPGVPTEAVGFADRSVTDANGVANLAILARDPGNPRGYIDGQVYGIRPALDETLAPGTDYPFNQWNFVSLLVWNSFQPDEPPSWYGSSPQRGLQPIFQQYANLYPVMQRFLDMADYDSVCAHQRLLRLAFGLDMRNPNSMPVTRDLSAAKRKAILRWLDAPGPDGKALKGRQPAAVAAAAVPARPPEEARIAPIKAFEGGKAAAANRRLGRRASGR